MGLKAGWFVCARNVWLRFEHFNWTGLDQLGLTWECTDG